jgi:NAD+ synthase
MTPRERFRRDLLRLDPVAEIERICASLRAILAKPLHRKGAVVAVSGGVDSSVVAGLCARALGPERVLTLLLPERDSSPDSLALGSLVARHFGISAVTQNVTPILEAAGCYRLQEEAVRGVFPAYGSGWKFKVTLPSVLASERLSISRLTVRSPDGVTRSERMPVVAYLQLIAATNFKQRVRKMVEYYNADRLNYAVVGTPNRLEYDQGFFVKGGDGLADVKPIAHLYKSQVYALARALGIPAEICDRVPTTDTFPLEQTQEEFFFGVPHEVLDSVLFGLNHGYAPADVALAVGLTEDQVGRLYRDIEAKRRATAPLHLPELLLSPVPEIGTPPLGREGRESG